MTDKTREDFEAWARPIGWPHSWQYLGTDEFGFDSESWATWKAATQQSAARIAALEAEVLALRRLARLPVEQMRLGVMCATDFRHELGEAAGGTVIYADEGDLKANRSCWEQCGIIKVEVRPVEAERGEG